MGEVLLHPLHTLLEVSGEVVRLVILSGYVLVVGHIGLTMLQAGSIGCCKYCFNAVPVESTDILGCLEVADVDSSGVSDGRLVDALDILGEYCLRFDGRSDVGVGCLVKPGVVRHRQ